VRSSSTLFLKSRPGRGPDRQTVGALSTLPLASAEIGHNATRLPGQPGLPGSRRRR